ncbi:MAG: DUF2911 domain-containing protein [Cytophagales bacterium]|nr:DUF2911 domain-containing protein [Cytophagales bacterium]
MTTVVVAALFFIAENTYAQSKSSRPSPPDQVSASIGNAKVTIDYSQPSAKGRDIFGGLVPYGKVWRTGANENTWIEVTTDVTIQGKKLAKGKYGLFSIPGKDEWTIIFNSVSNEWGDYAYSASNDVLRVKAKSSKTKATEKFTISISGSTVTLAWDETKVEFEIKG